MTDANIAAIVVAANNADVANGKEARDKTKNADVKSFANQMMVDHTAVNDKAEALAKKLDLTPEDNDASKGIKASQDSIRSSFESKKGVDYDRAYVDNEVAVHESVLKTIDDVLLPNVKSAELKQLITDTRPVIAMHLEHAKELQAKISVKTSK